jgi:adenosylcobinamide-GDP ribazoletransferase
MSGLRWAFGFITILPVQPKAALADGELGRAAGWFPVVGLALGAVLWLAHSWLLGSFSPLLAACLTVAIWALASGGLHLDGVADCCDGLFASAPAQRRLEILDDVHVGAFGVIGVALLLLLKVAALSETDDPASLLLVPMIGRWLPLVMARAKPAKSAGLGGQLHRELAAAHWLWALPMIGVALAFGWVGLAATTAALVSALALGQLARARLGGQTGDVLGAGVELGEVAALLAFAAVGG